VKKNIITIAKELRKAQTRAEKLLWENVRNRKLNGYKIRRQYPINNSYIADFYCASKRLIIEIDGGIHERKDIKENDKIREQFIKEWGYRIIRFSNKQVFEELNKVLQDIVAELKK